jgi:hypothetical protein
MKKLKIIIYVLFFQAFFLAMYSQPVELVTGIVSSPNEKFKITIKGLASSAGYGGKQNIMLKDNTGRVLWKKEKLAIGGPPIVSNIGIVAIDTGINITFFDTSGNIFGSYKMNDSIEQFWIPDAADYLDIGQFSPNGKYFYVIMDKLDVQYLSCLSISGQKLWQFEINRTKPLHSSLHIGVEPFNGGIFAFYRIRDNNDQSSCYLLNEKGKLIRKYDNEFGTGYYSIQADDKKNVFTVLTCQKGYTIKVYSLKTGLFKYSKYFESKAAWINWRKKNNKK